MPTTTGQPRNRKYIRVSQQRKTKLRWPENSIEHQTYTGGAAAAVRVYTYVCIQARPISTNPGSMEEECEYGLPSSTCFNARRLEVSRSPGCCGYISRCVFLVFGGISCFVSVFFTSNAHGLLQVRGNLASCTSLLVMRQGRGSEATEAVCCL